MKKRHVLMLGNRLKGIAGLMRNRQLRPAQYQIDRLKFRLEPAVQEAYSNAIDMAREAYANNDADLIEIIADGLIENALKG